MDFACGSLVRRVGVVVLASSVAISVVACTSPSPAATPEATPSASGSEEPDIDTSTWIGQVIDPVGTTWVGTDSAGETTVFTLNDDHTVDVTYGASAYSDTNDVWRVAAGALAIDVFIDDIRGTANYSATWDPATSILSATAMTTLTGDALTVALTQQ